MTKAPMPHADLLKLRDSHRELLAALRHLVNFISDRYRNIPSTELASARRAIATAEKIVK